MRHRDAPSGDEHPHLDKLLPNKQRREATVCPSTTQYLGYAECVLQEGHAGDHSDIEGVTWPEEDSIY